MAGIFGFFDYTKEGPGIAKDAPKKRPFVVFFEIFGRKFWNLVVAGLLYLLVSLPIVTRGWAQAGLTFITRNYAREKHAFVKDDFFETIRKNRGQALGFGIINLLVSAMLCFNIVYYALALNPGLYGLIGVPAEQIKEMINAGWKPGIFDYLVMGVTGFGTIMFTWMKYYIPFLTVTFKLKTKQVYKNAFIFALAGLKQNLLICVVMLLIYAIIIASVVFLPPVVAIILGILYLLVVPGFRSLLVQFTIFPVIKRLMIDPYYRDNPDADKQARLDLNLEVEPDKPAVTADGEPEEDEPIFSDAAPLPTHEEPDIPRQYTEQEMRRFNSRRAGANEDDDTI